MSLIDKSHDHANYEDISRSSCGMNMTSTTTVSCSVATSSSESLPNDGEKPNQPKRLISEKQLWPLDFHEASIQFSTQHKWYS